MATNQPPGLRPTAFDKSWISVTISAMFCALQPFVIWGMNMQVAASQGRSARITGVLATLVHGLEMARIYQFLFIPIMLILAVGNSFRRTVLPIAKGVLWLLFGLSLLNAFSFLLFFLAQVNK